MKSNWRLSKFTTGGAKLGLCLPEKLYVAVSNCFVFFLKSLSFFLRTSFSSLKLHANFRILYFLRYIFVVRLHKKLNEIGNERLELQIFWWHLNFLIITFIFKIVIFANFFVDSQPIRQKFEKLQPRWHITYMISDTLSFLYSKNDMYGFSTKKALYQNVEKTPFFETFDPIASLWDKNRKK
jgi:hypothetical protein